MSLLTPTEYQQIIFDWNKTDRDYPKDKTIQQLFEEQVLRTPDAIAVVYGEQRLTYAELNNRSNQLARHLRSQLEIVPDTLIALCVGRNLDVIIGILGILKAGGAYIPIDPEYPAERIKYILDDTRAKLVLTQSCLLEKFEMITDVSLVELDTDCYKNEQTTNLPPNNKATDLAYVIYTSGTTGEPKGVMVEHGQFSTFILSFAEQPFIKSLQKLNVLSLTNYAFDIFGLEYGLPLLFGGCVYISDYTNIDDSHLKESSIIQQTPSVIEIVCDSKKDLLNDKLCLVGGEKLSVNTAIKSLKFFREVINVYGPTESVIWSSSYTLSLDAKVYIGKPLFNEKFYVLDSDYNPVPIGAVGELHIGGAGLARGYLNKLQLTAEKFVKNTFATVEDEANGYTRLYKTGDLVKWLPDGNLEYIGRDDSQVKIRGYRIELGEVEHELVLVDNIKQACVLARERNGDKYLVGYFVSDNELDKEQIFSHLSKKLPDHMIPSALVRMESFPLTHNGKLDRKAFPDPEFTSEDAYISPVTELEEKLCVIWQEVLNLGRVGITDDFFRIGGDSILAIRVVIKIGEVLSTVVSVADIFTYKTISNLSAHLLSNEAVPVKILPVKLDRYPLSFGQERLWFIEQYEQGTNAYHVPLLIELQADVDKNKLKDVLQKVVQRHEVLRTIFRKENGVYHQVIIEGDLIINEYNCLNKDINEQIKKDINEPFDLESEIPVRVSLYNSSDDLTKLLINIHHVASDGWSSDVLLREIDALYRGRLLPMLPVQYKDFAHWQREYLQGEALQDQLSYWREKLYGHEPLTLPTDNIRPQKIDYSGGDIHFIVNRELSDKLRKLSRKNSCTLYTTLLSGFFVLLNKYTDQNDIVLGTPIANRHYPATQELIGLFVNSLALRECVNEESNITEFIYQVQNDLIEAQRHQDLPFEKLVREFKDKQDISRHPVFQVMFGVQSFGNISESDLFRSLDTSGFYSVAQYDLSCFMDDSQGEIRGLFNFATSLYKRTTVERMVKHFLLVLEQMVNDTEKKLKDFRILTADEYQQIIVGWNKTDRDYPKDKTIQQLFEEQVLRTPHAVAVVFEDCRLTYTELNEQSNQLARYLQTQVTIKPDTLIALCVDRSLDVIVGILGILKAGGAYIPIDPEYPAERIKYILDDTQTMLVLTQSHVTEKLKSVASINFVELDSNCYQDQEVADVSPHSKASDLAYVIYTSGTTGRPKGVMISHQNIVSTANSITQICDFRKAGEKIAQVASLSFDTFCLDISLSITNGHELYIVPSELRKDPSLLVEYIHANRITYTDIPTKLYESFAQEDIKKLDNVKYLVVGGELLNKILTNGHFTFINAYGPTETTVESSLYLNPQEHETNVIGKPLFNEKFYVLNSNCDPVPVGVIGELHIGGAGLARGYLNKPQLTAEKFIENPFSTTEDKANGYTRLYKTGDMVRWLPDGNLEYIGRNDFQVKIRGYRIELGEIEHVLSTIEGIAQACVLAREKDGTQYLVGYLVANGEIDTEQIFGSLPKKLPDYMIPSALVCMESFPLTPNGKLDRKAFPVPKFTSDDVYTSPTTELEERLCVIWQEILNLGRVGITDDFFRIGGDSILSIKLTSRLRKDNLHCNVRDIFETRTIQKLARHIEGSDQFAIAIDQTMSEDQANLLPSQFLKCKEGQEFVCPASSLQEGFIYHALKYPDDDAYRVQVTFEYTQELNINNYIRSWEYAIQKYPILRTAFNWEEDVLQIVYNNAELNYRVLDISNLSVIEREKYVHNLQKEDRSIAFDLTKPCLLRLYIVKHADRHYTILKSQHHSILDGWSDPILLDAVHRNYYELQKGKSVKVVIDESYLNAQNYFVKNKDVAETYWKEKVSVIRQVNDLSPLLSKRLDLNDIRSLKDSYDTTLEITGDLYLQLKELAKKEGLTLSILVQFAWYKLVQIYTQDSQTIIGVTVSGRGIPVTGIEDSVGFYINTLPFVVDWDNHNTILQQLRCIHEQTVDMNAYSFAHLASLQEGAKRLFYSLFVFENYPIPETLRMKTKDILVSEAEYTTEKLDYPLVVVVSEENNNKLCITLKSDTQILNLARSNNNLSKIKLMLEEILIKLNEPHDSIFALVETEYQNFVIDRNKTNKKYEREKTLHQLFMQQAENCRDKIAVIDVGGEYSYFEIKKWSDSIANFLCARSKKDSQLVGIYSQKGYQQVVAALGVLSSGFAYLPLSMSWPTERVDTVLIEGGVRQVLISKNCYQRFVHKTFLEDKYEWLIIEDVLALKMEFRPLPYVDATNIAYVIFTSGSTGKPKGVTISHEGAVNTILSVNDEFNVGSNDSVLALSDLSFDLSVFDIFGLLAAGGVVVFPDQEQINDPSHWIDLVSKHHVTIWNTVPQIMQLLINHVSEQDHKLKDLRLVLLSGDLVPLSISDNIKSLNKSIRVVSLGGATECSIWSIWYEINEVKKEWDSIPYGFPMPNQKVFILDQYMRPCPPGVMGEIYIGGLGVALSYWNNIDKTSDSFKNHEEFGRIYKTGDLGKFHEAGYIVFQGRIDTQVKIRGYRVELGEIEHALLSVEGVGQVCILIKEKAGDKYLAGYFVSDKELKYEDILRHLSRQLPDYMVPSALVRMESFPLTPNGKLDRKAFPDLDFVSESVQVQPETNLEKKLCIIWQDVLNLEKVGVTDDFFRIGGDSILSIKLTSKLRKHGLLCSIRDVFEARTIQQLAKRIEEITNDEIIAEQGMLTGQFDLLPIQRWFFDQVEIGYFKKGRHFNQSFLVKVPKLKKEKLQNIIQTLSEHHDILRTVYKGERQEYLSQIDVPELRYLNVEKLSEEDLNNELTNWQSNFNLSEGPLWVVGYLEGYEDGSARLFFALHHLIVDAVSWRILIEDFRALYNGEKLDPKSSSYRQWIKEVSLYAERHQPEREYWEKVLASTSAQVEKGECVTSSFTKLGKVLTNILLQRANYAYHTEVNDLLLTALALALQSLNNESAQIVTLEGHGRENICDNLDHSRTVGWFTTMFPVRLETQDDLGSSIKHIKEELRKVPNKGVGFGILNPDKLINLPRISFNYLGQFDTEDTYWQIMPENSGSSIHADNVDSNIIDFNGMVVEGELRFDVVTKLNKETTDKFVENFKGYLEEIVLHCDEVVKNNQSQYTPSDFGATTISQQLLNEIQEGGRIEHIYPASSLQQGLVSHVLNYPEDDAYRIQATFEYEQELDADLYITSWKLALQKYPILRTAFNWEEEIIQVTYDNAELDYQILDVSDLSEKKQDEYILNFQREDRKTAFNLTKPCLLRLGVVKRAKHRYTIIKTQHHCILDGWSDPILLATVHKSYHELRHGRSVKVVRENSYIEAQEYFIRHKDNVEKYWQDKVSTIKQANDLTPFLSTKQDLNTVRLLNDSYDNGVEITGDLYLQLKELTRKEGLTLNILVQFVWHKLIQIYTQDQQTVVGVTVSGRDVPVAGIEEGVGLYINTLPLVVDWGNQNTVLQQLRSMHQQIMDINMYSFAYLANMQTGTERLFHSLFVFENYPIPERVMPSGEEMLISKSEHVVEKLDYPLTVMVSDNGHGLHIILKSDLQILSRKKSEYVLSKIKLLLEKLTVSLNGLQSSMSIFTDPEYRQIIKDWNKTEKAYSNNETIHQVFEEQTLKTPNAVAVVFEDQSLTYRELNAKANQLARYIQTQTEVKSDTLIALCADRSLEMIVGILGVLKAGGAYVPIDPEYPMERIHYILSDTKTKLILTQSHIAKRLQSITGISLIELDSDCYHNQDVVNPSPCGKASDLAYVIYTSGTTGNPKGATTTHELLVNRLMWQKNTYNFNESDNVVQKTPFVFDVSVWELILPLISGSKLTFAKAGGHKDPEYLYMLFEGSKITKAHFVPSMLHAFIEYLESNNITTLTSLEQVFCSGEALPIKLARDFKSLFPNIILNNLYGPTEVAIDVSSYDDIPIDTELIHIGKPIQNIKFYILDQNGLPVPIGVIGELYIGGINLTKGYLNKPELTKEKFVPNVFATKEEKTNGYTRLYKTGDLVRWLPDGDVEYLGRNDFQVKVRGYRIEIGEIEYALSSINGIKQACVLAKEKSGNKYLVGYYVSETKIEEKDILNYLSTQLPDYMIPSVLVHMSSFPLTINGKLDRKALPDSNFTSGGTYIPPTTDLEKQLCTIWQDVLNLERVGITDDFFRIGGDSILVIRAVSKIKKLGVKISVRDFFIYKTIENLPKILGYDSESEDVYEEYSLINEDEYDDLVKDLEIKSDL